MLPGQKQGKFIMSSSVNSRNRADPLWKKELPEGVPAIITKLFYELEHADKYKYCSDYATTGCATLKALATPEPCEPGPADLGGGLPSAKKDGKGTKAVIPCLPLSEPKADGESGGLPSTLPEAGWGSNQQG